MAQRLKRPGQRSRSSLVSAGQPMDVLGKRSPRATDARALEAPNLNRKHHLLFPAWPLSKVSEVSAMEPVAPAAAPRARSGADAAGRLDADQPVLLTPADNFLADRDERSREAIDDRIRLAISSGGEALHFKLEAASACPGGVTQSVEDSTSLRLTAGLGYVRAGVAIRMIRLARSRPTSKWLPGRTTPAVRAFRLHRNTQSGPHEAESQ
jgi:hypothetical protein